MNSQPTPGTLAPDFDAAVVGGSYPEGTRLKLSDLRGQTIVLYFYPKDDTPGCTKQACALRDGWSEISSKTTVFGVSIDSIKSHEKFIKKYSLPFPILSDEDQSIVNAYGVWVEKSMYGNTYFALLPSWPRGETALDIPVRTQRTRISNESADAWGACQKTPVGPWLEADRRRSDDRDLALRS
ncbi:peroxiredoxin [Prosthecobacter fusiformis]|uniref:thioredoxin-dependent peroxiredoxin n=1 Tax=Prosthecobacter fusiformis TaxID=48464 RepID=A0A4R7SP56_9BACT|nr:peroxiredoxin [Prosthecobacter fusiformis]TDU80771.1 peroxiredoxin [Prosthecobacter fusiformis]